MNTVNLGRTGIKVTRICFGCMSYGTRPWQEWVLDEDAARPFFRKAWEAGINFYDTADVYSFGTSEEILGRALRELNIPREQVVVATTTCSRGMFNSRSARPRISSLVPNE